LLSASPVAGDTWGWHTTGSHVAISIRWDVVHRPHFIKPGTRVINQWQIGQALTGDLDLNPPVNVFTNPVTQAAEQDKIVAGLSREDLFTVVSEHFMTDTADYADIVLPATTQVENLDLMFSWGHIRDLNMPATTGRSHPEY